MPSCELSIVIPCLNEEKTLGTCIAKAQSFLRLQNVEGEVIVADNGSTDGSAQIAREAGARVVHVEEKGYGSAILRGLNDATGTYVVIGDGDDSYDFSSLLPFLTKLREGYDLVMGNRFLGGIRPGAMPWLHRYIGNPVLSRIGNLFFGSAIHDFHCGLRGVRRDALPKLGLHATGMEFATEMVIKAMMLRLRVTEVPTVLHPDGRGRPPHLRTWRDGWRHLRLLLLFAPSWLFLYPGMFLMITGIAAGAWLLPAQRYVFDIHTLLYCGAFIVMGLNALSFGLLAKVFAMDSGLVPPSPLLRRIYGKHSLEIGLITGLCLLLSGIGVTLWAVLLWQRTNFSDLDPRQMLRLVIPAITLLFAGMQIIFVSFFLSVLRIRLIRHEN